MGKREPLHKIHDDSIIKEIQMVLSKKQSGGKHMFLDNNIYLGLADEGRVFLPLNMANRHGLVAGASGTGKTITMKVMAESFSDAGVPVFLCFSQLAVPL